MYETRKTSTIRRSAGWLLAVVFALSLCWQQALASPAEEKTVIPLGKAVGIKLFADGVLVVGLTENSDCPARQCGLREGDIITAVSGRHISSTEQVQALLQTNGGTPRPAHAVHDRLPCAEQRRHVAAGRMDTGQHGGHRHADLL